MADSKFMPRVNTDVIRKMIFDFAVDQIDSDSILQPVMQARFLSFLNHIYYRRNIVIFFACPAGPGKVWQY